MFDCTISLPAWNPTIGNYAVRLNCLERIIRLLPDCLLRLTPWGSRIADTKDLSGRFKVVTPITVSPTTTSTPQPIDPQMSSVGIKNIGNSCYLNAMLQSVVHCPSLVQQIGALSNGSMIVDTLKHFISEYKKRGDLSNHVEVIRDVLNHLDPQKFDNGIYAQYDAFDFLITLFNELNLKPFEVNETNPSGKKQATYRTLEVPFSDSLKESLDQFMKEVEMLEYPEVLPIRLKRFDNQMNYLFGLTDVADEINLGEVRYKLKSVLIKEGKTIDSGHYVACVKTGEDEWYVIDDNEVRLIQPSELCKGYGFIYQKI